MCTQNSCSMFPLVTICCGVNRYIFLVCLQETFTPIWYMAIILVMKYSIPNTPYPAILSPRGTSSLFKGKNDLVWANPNLGVTPNDSNTRDFVNNHVLKAPQLQVYSEFLTQRTSTLHNPITQLFCVAVEICCAPLLC